jgi:hypothetical protein
MKRLAIVLAGFAALVTIAHAAVPSTVTFTARLVDEETNEVLTGDHTAVFTLYDAATGGNVVWTEEHAVTPDDGMIYVDLGTTQMLGETVFSGKALYLQVSLDGTLMEPRISLSSVPYAVRAAASDKASDAEKVGGVGLDGLQRRVTGTCNTGQYLRGVNGDGSVTCADDSTSTGDITEVTAGPGLVGGAMAGAATVALMSCSTGQVLKAAGNTWMCASDDDAGGDITGVTAGPGLVGGGNTGAVSLSLPTNCGANQLLKWTGSTWTCATDVDTDTNSGGTITGVTIGPAGGLIGGGTTGNVTLSLPSSCAPNQLLKWSGTSWVCSGDLDTNSGGTINGVVAGAGLAGGGSSGSVTVNVGQGIGVVVQADQIALDTTYTDARYLTQASGDARYLMLAGGVMTGTINMNGQRVINQGCPTGYTSVGAGLCVEHTDQCCFTFSGAANRCRAAGAHLCSSIEMRAVMSSGVTLGTTTLQDWLGDQDADDSALYVNNATNADNPDGVRTTSTSSWSRCCLSVE